jgi:hypothetical protein
MTLGKDPQGESIMDSNSHAMSRLQDEITGESIYVLCVAKIWGSRESSQT